MVDKIAGEGVVNAIEVISAPKDLVPETAQYLSPSKVQNFEGLNKQSLEVVYRVTVGGVKVTPFNDSLWRTWIPCLHLFLTIFSFHTICFPLICLIGI